MNLLKCRLCQDKFKSHELSEVLQLCKTCENTPISQTYKQCKYCRSDFKSSLGGNTCLKCAAQTEKHGEPSACTICRLPMVFGNEVICVRCSHYRAKFGDPRQCETCCQYSAFYKDNISRQKVDGKILCWLCTYYFKLQKAKSYKSMKDKRNDSFAKNLDKVSEFSLSRNESSSSLLNMEPLSKRIRVDDDTSLPLYSNDTAYNEQLLKISGLQEEIKELKRKIAIKDSELLSKDNQITGLKADLLRKEQDFAHKDVVMKDRWEKERQNLTDKIKNLQRENINLLKGKRKKKQEASGLQFLTKDPLTRLPPSYNDSPKGRNIDSPKIRDTDSPKPSSESPKANDSSPDIRNSISPKLENESPENSDHKLSKDVSSADDSS